MHISRRRIRIRISWTWSGAQMSRRTKPIEGRRTRAWSTTQWLGLRPTTAGPRGAGPETVRYSARAAVNRSSLNGHPERFVYSPLTRHVSTGKSLSREEHSLQAPLYNSDVTLGSSIVYMLRKNNIKIAEVLRKTLFYLLILI